MDVHTFAFPNPKNPVWGGSKAATGGWPAEWPPPGAASPAYCQEEGAHVPAVHVQPEQLPGDIWQVQLVSRSSAHHAILWVLTIMSALDRTFVSWPTGCEKRVSTTIFQRTCGLEGVIGALGCYYITGVPTALSSSRGLLMRRAASSVSSLESLAECMVPGCWRPPTFSKNGRRRRESAVCWGIVLTSVRLSPSSSPPSVTTGLLQMQTFAETPAGAESSLSRHLGGWRASGGAWDLQKTHCGEDHLGCM